MYGNANRNRFYAALARQQRERGGQPEMYWEDDFEGPRCEREDMAVEAYLDEDWHD